MARSYSWVSKKSNVCTAVCSMSHDSERDAVWCCLFFQTTVSNSRHLSPTQTQLRMQRMISAGDVS